MIAKTIHTAKKILLKEGRQALRAFSCQNLCSVFKKTVVLFMIFSLTSQTIVAGVGGSKLTQKEEVTSEEESSSLRASVPVVQETIPLRERLERRREERKAKTELESLEELFLKESGAMELGIEGSRDKKSFPYLVISRALSEYGLSREAGDRYQSTEEERVVGSLVVRKPSNVYMEHKGLYHGYRLFFGNGYIVPSLLFKKTNTADNTSDFFEILPVTGALKELKDLRKHAYEVGVHVLGQFLFPVQGEGGSPL